MRRLTKSTGFSFVAALILVVFLTGPISQVLANLVGSSFEGNDGDLVVTTTGYTDWESITDLLNTGIDRLSGSNDNAFGQGTKEDNPNVTVVAGSIPPNKNDLTRFYEASEMASNGDIYLYLGWERAVNIGNANLDFEINQNATAGFTRDTTGPVTLNRTAGDLLVTYDFGGSGTPTLGLLTWLTAAHGDSASDCFSTKTLPCWGNRVNLTGAGEAEGAVNSATIDEPIAGGTLTAGLFGEAAIDLTAAGVFQEGVCSAFGSTFLKSRSSSSFTAEIKDFIAPIPVSISNCGTITIDKVTENGDDTFDFTATGGLSPETFSLANGESQIYESVDAGSYAVAEDSSLPTGWTLKSISCTTDGTGTTATVDGSTVTIEMGLGGSVECTYTNHTKLSPTIATTLSATSVSIGTEVHDSATLTGATSDAGGTATYTVYTDEACTAKFADAGIVDVADGLVPDSDGVTFTAAGTYYWQADYSGDDNNNSATSICTDEILVVDPNSPSIATTLSATSVSIGDSVYDSATLRGATSDAGGTVTYTVYTDASCSVGAVDAGTVGVTNGVVLDSNSVTFTAAGTYYWQAAYSGDANNDSATSVCTSEQLVVNPNSPDIATTLSATSVTIGDSVHDSATLTGATSDAGGTVTYTVYTDDACTAEFADAGTKTVTNGIVPDSDAVTFDHAGTYYWQAAYSGDANNDGATSVCTDETLVVQLNRPSMSTAQDLLPNDSATISGATGEAGGTITFSLYSPSDETCSAAPAYSEDVSVNGNGTYSTDNTTFHATAEGTWRWQVTYSGDDNNVGTASACGVENFTIANSAP